MTRVPPIGSALAVTAIVLADCMVASRFIPASTAIAQEVSKQSPIAIDGASLDARQKLELRQSELDEAERRAKSIQTNVTDIVEEREKLSARLQETATLIQKSEGRLTATEEKLTGLERQEGVVRQSLEKNKDKIVKLMAALQRMGRNPPPVLYTQRNDALQMVRSAMLVASAFPELRKDANELAQKLGDLIGVKQAIAAERDLLRTETQRLGDARTRLAGLMETKKKSLAERQGELEQVRKAAAELSRGVGDLNDLIGKLDQAVAANTGLGAYDADAKRSASETTITVAAGPSAAIVKPQVPAGNKTLEVAALNPPPPSVIKPTIVELAPKSALGAGAASRLQPAIPFQLAKARLPMPAQGKRVLTFGDKTQYGGQSKGVVVETRSGAQVTSPCDGWVVYAGEFRSYGQLLIINAGNGYHVLLAGMSQIDVQPGQFVLAAEPVGTMSGRPQPKNSQDGQSSAPVLYVEFRKDGRPIDPDPWWAEGHRKVQG